MSLLFANRTPEDVMLKEELDALATASSRFRVDYTVDQVPDGSAATWEGKTGVVSAEKIRDAFDRLPGGRPELVCVCGPMGFNKAVKTALTEELKYSSDEIFEF